MVETLEGLGMLPVSGMVRRGPFRPVFDAGDGGDGPTRFRRGNGGIVPPRPVSEMTPARPLPLPGNGGIVPPGGVFFPLLGRPGNTGIVPPARIPFISRSWWGDKETPAPTATPAPVATVQAAANVPPPNASAVTGTYTPTYSASDVVDEGAWTPPDDALIQDQYGLDQGVDEGLKDDLYASQDFQADGEGASYDNGLWGLDGAMDLIPALMPDQPTAVAAPSGGFLSNLGNFIQSALPAAAQVYASVQATKQGNPYGGAQVAQQVGRPMGTPYNTGAAYPSGAMPGGYPGGYAPPSWFSQRTIFPSLSNGAVIGIGVAVAAGVFLLMKKHRGA